MFQGRSKPSWADANQGHLGMEARGRRKTGKMKERGEKRTKEINKGWKTGGRKGALERSKRKTRERGMHGQTE